MSTFINREQLQEKALVLSNTSDYLLLEWATRVGKTPATIKIIKKNPGCWNIVVAETIHIHQWKTEFKKFNAHYLLKDINIFCYHSLHKHKEDINVNWVFDEAHHMFSDKRWKLISTINSYARAIFLSATLTLQQKDKLINRFTPFVQHKFSLKEAIANKILPQPNVYIVELTLLDEEPTNLWQMRKGKQLHATGVVCDYSERWKYYFAEENKDLLLHVRCTDKEYYNLLNTEYEKAKKSYQQGYSSKYSKITWLKSGLNRKRFLASLKTKTAQEIIEYLKEKRFICFASSIKQSVILGGDLTVNSTKSLKTNQRILEDFNSTKINKLFAVNMFQEGINLKNIDAGIIMQLDSRTRSFIQKSGRILLADIPELFIIYIKNTRDEYYLNETLKELDEKYVYKTKSILELIEMKNISKNEKHYSNQNKTL